MEIDEKWVDLPAQWASGTLATDVVDPRKLLTLEFESQFEKFSSRICAVADWDAEVPPCFLYPFPIRWSSMTKKVLRELGIVKEHIIDLDMPKPAMDRKKS